MKYLLIIALVALSLTSCKTERYEYRVHSELYGTQVVFLDHRAQPGAWIWVQHSGIGNKIYATFYTANNVQSTGHIATVLR